MRDQDDSPDWRLRTIADLLGIPVERFFDDGATPRPAETAELMRLWLMIEHEQDRAKVLAFIRTAAVPEPPARAAE